MYQFVAALLLKIGFSDYTDEIAYAICIIAGVILCIILRILIRRITTHILTKINERRQILIIEAVLESKLFKRASNVAIPIIIYIFTFNIDIPQHRIFWDKSVEISLVITVFLILNSCIKIISKVYSSWEISKNFPIRGILQAVEIAVFFISGIIAVSALVGKNPTVLIGSIGAVTAVTSIVFKDAILGFAAGIQLTVNGMIRIGDWIELPKRSANGTVVDLSMMTVKVENFDKTVTSIPAYTLISEEFINWRGIREAGARRIKRSIFIDAAGVRICDGEMINKLKEICLLQDYINQNLNCEMSETTNAINSKCMTNIGVFRAYITAYLNQRADIRKDLPLMVRQLESSGKGIPLEIYAFTNVAVWAEYENIQSDIFDHLYSIISEFGLMLYQSPSSGDMRQITKL